MKEKGKKVAGAFMIMAGMLLIVANIIDHNILLTISGLCIVVTGVLYII